MDFSEVSCILSGFCTAGSSLLASLAFVGRIGAASEGRDGSPSMVYTKVSKDTHVLLF